MTDTTANVIDEFDPDAIFARAQARRDEILSKIQEEQQKRLDAEASIRDLRESLAKVDRIISAGTPRTRTKKVDADAAKPAKSKAAKPAKQTTKAAPAPEPLAV